MTIRSYSMLPALPEAPLLARYIDTLGVIVPLARTNLVTNPSVETNATGYTSVGGATVDRTYGTGFFGNSSSFHGGYALAVGAGLAAGGGLYYGPVTLAATTYYAYSCKFIGDPGVSYKMSIATTGAVDLSVTRFNGAGVWQWVWGIHYESAGAARRLYVTRETAAAIGNSSFNVDGVQIESCADGILLPTTYIDGDQRGLVPNQYPPAYGWNGTPHASTSYRTGQTRAGGYVRSLKSYGFLLTAIIGLGMAPPDLQALTFAQLDGGQYLDTIKPPRQFSLAGRWAGYTPNEIDAGQGALGAVLDRDLVALRQPLVLTTQAQDCGTPIGELCQIQAIYQGGMEGNTQEVPSATGAISFTTYLPMIFGPDQGVPLDVQDSLTSIGGILACAPGGTWAKLGAGTNGSVNAILIHPNGDIYVGGSFTDAGGSGADNLAKYTPSTATWSVVKSATSIGNTVNALALGPNGVVYIGGTFSNADGIANADFIVSYNPTTNTYAALSTGMNNTVNALVAGKDGKIYATGSFTTAGGVAGVNGSAYWDGAAWNAMGSGSGVGNALAVGPDGAIYLGGGANIGGVAAADGIGKWYNGAWSALSTGMNGDVNAVAVGLDGTVYAGGIFTTAGGVTAGGVAAFNGVQWRQLGSGFSSPGIDTPNAMAVRADGVLLIASSGSVVDPGTPGQLFMWDGSAFVDLGVTGLSSGDAVVIAPDGTVYAGVSGTATAAGITTATNTGTADMYPRLVISGPSSGTSRIYNMTNMTTGAAIYFNYTINAGETATLILDPTNISFASDFQGNIISKILPGSNTSNFLIQPGANTIGFLAASSTVTAAMSWTTGYSSLNNAIRRASP